MTLDQFLVQISTSPDALTEFISNPARAMSDAGLSATEQQALHAGSAHSVYQRIADGGAPDIHAETPVHDSE
jgi:hypothetical protein